MRDRLLGLTMTVAVSAAAVTAFMSMSITPTWAQAPSARPATVVVGAACSSRTISAMMWAGSLREPASITPSESMKARFAR